MSKVAVLNEKVISLPLLNQKVVSPDDWIIAFSKLGFYIDLPITRDLFFCSFCHVFKNSYYANHIIARHIVEGKRWKLKWLKLRINSKSVAHTQVHWSREPRGSWWVVRLVSYRRSFNKLFKAGFTYNEIVDIFSFHSWNKYKCSDTTLYLMGLLNEKNRIHVIDMALDFISNELLSNGWHIGYLIMHQHLCTNNIFVDKEAV